jgi:anti-sigma-K factor RskA
MPVNDPGEAQYQLWIIDPERDTHPVDGGVFNVSSSGEVIIPVQARLPVDRPTTFAITLEKPGGVVVSAGPLLVVASAG